jgi:predicted amidohydrolase YtcJ
MRLAVLLAVCSAAICAPTLVVHNARVWTGNPSQPRAEAIAVTGARVEAVGSNEDVRALIGAQTRVIDARGASLIPGFIDAHLHVVWYRESVHPPLFLRFKRTRAEFVETVAAAAGKIPEGDWIIGVDWHEESWGGAVPTRSWIDRVTPKHPVWLRRWSGDAGVANAVALRLAGIDPATSNGLIRGGGMWRIDNAIVEHNLRAARRDHPGGPQATQSGYENDDRALEAVFRRLLSAGITSVHHTGGWQDMLLLRRLRNEGRLPVRVRACTQLKSWARLRDYVAEFGRGDEWLRWDCLKGFGAMSAQECHDWIAGASRAGLQVMVHVTEQPGLPALLDTYARVGREQNTADQRFRVEHAHTMPPEIIRKFVDAGVIASVQPPLLQKFDTKEARYAYPWKAVMDAGITIAFGTDSIATTSLITPVQSIRLARQRPGPDGAVLSLEEALRFYTRDAAYAGFEEREKGTLEAGKLADFVVFNCDLFANGGAWSSEPEVVLTVAGGEVKYDAASRER